MLVKIFELGKLTGKIFKTSIGYYHKIYYGKQVVAQMYYYSHTYQDAEDNMFDTAVTIDTTRLEENEKEK